MAQLGLSDEEKVRLIGAIANDTLTNDMVNELRARVENPILTLVEDAVTLGPTCGYETIARATEVFTGGIYYYGCTAEDIDVADQQETESRPGRVYAMDPDKCVSATFEEMFTTFGDPGRAAVPQGEIITFCKKTPEKLHQGGYGTFFLFEVKGNRFVAYVRVVSGELRVSVYRFGFDYRWYAGYRHRVVAPQL